MENKTILSGMRPTGKLHLGHWVGALSNWTRLQEKYHCYFMVADWHALMSEYKDSSSIKEFAIDNVADWLSCGIDPNKSNIFIQSQVPEHLELSMILSVMVPLGWLLRCPTFKDQVKQLKDKEVNTYAFLGYPVLQSADILLYKADTVPVGEDQLPHLELCREIVRKFHLITKTEVFIEPQPLLTNIPRFLGIDGRKMSKSYKNDIALDEDDKNLEIKVLAMFTDPQRKRRNDPGRPQICNVFSSYLIFKEEFKDEVHDWCIKAKKGCRDCKKMLYEIIKDFIAPIREKKEELLKDKNYIKDILEEGRKKAKNTAIQTIKETREALKL
ncbi:MAG: tryptophan--tRNA ligase [Candidatus Omnitrophica bacterium]|nr:tryptophan--tRNA ligase [Candidatus Omnitrophota bacterium]MCK5393384.1 tryptophan--tRNA ligase [Candidatus Omnitrophota bacterium]